MGTDTPTDIKARRKALSRAELARADIVPRVLHLPSCQGVRMLIDHLDASEKNALLLLLKRQARADGVTDPSERRFIKELAAAVGHKGAQRASRGRASQDELCRGFQRPVSRRVALVKLIQIGWADGDYDESERAAVLDIAAQMGVDASVVERIERAVDRGVDWDGDEGRQILGA